MLPFPSAAGAAGAAAPAAQAAEAMACSTSGAQHRHHRSSAVVSIHFMFEATDIMHGSQASSQSSD
jgi:hypothetical protein